MSCGRRIVFDTSFIGNLHFYNWYTLKQLLQYHFLIEPFSMGLVYAKHYPEQYKWYKIENKREYADLKYHIIWWKRQTYKNLVKIKGLSVAFITKIATFSQAILVPDSQEVLMMPWCLPSLERYTNFSCDQHYCRNIQKRKYLKCHSNLSELTEHKIITPT